MGGWQRSLRGPLGPGPVKLTPRGGPGRQAPVPARVWPKLAASAGPSRRPPGLSVAFCCHYTNTLPGQTAARPPRTPARQRSVHPERQRGPPGPCQAHPLRCL